MISPIFINKNIIKNGMNCVSTLTKVKIALHFKFTNMQKTTRTSFRPLTTKMVELLMDCHERELHQQAPYSIYYTQTAKGLVTRGLFYVKQYTEGPKPYMGFYITQLGIDYLNKMQ